MKILREPCLLLLLCTSHVFAQVEYIIHLLYIDIRVSNCNFIARHDAERNAIFYATAVRFVANTPHAIAPEVRLKAVLSCLSKMWNSICNNFFSHSN